MRALKTIGLAALLGVTALAAVPQDAFAGDRRYGRGGHHHHHHGRGWGPPPRPVYVAPRYYAPPPRVYYAPPPPVYYAPPPRYYYAPPPPAYYAPRPGVSLNFRF